jgi:hypothetical protein
VIRRVVGVVALALVAVACSQAPDVATPAPATGRPTPKTDPGDDASRYKDAATLAQRADDLLGTDQCIQTGAAFSALIAEPTALAAGGASSDKIDQFKHDIESLKTRVPDSLQGDMATLAEAYETSATELAAFGTAGTDDLRQRTQDAQDALQRLQDPKVQQAEQHLSDYFSDCTTKLTR